MSKIILASKSPRRQELLKTITEDFTVIPSNVQEILPGGIAVEESAVYLASLKAHDISKNHFDNVVIGCDTVVIINGEILGKPENKDSAREMISKLSGNVHTVITGCCICFKGEEIKFSQHTTVEFYSLSPKEIEEYISTDEPYDKAGAYGIQDKGRLLVKTINGDFFNVMGLPVARLSRELKKFM